MEVVIDALERHLDKRGTTIADVLAAPRIEPSGSLTQLSQSKAPRIQSSARSPASRSTSGNRDYLGTKSAADPRKDLQLTAESARILSIRPGPNLSDAKGHYAGHVTFNFDLDANATLDVGMLSIPGIGRPLKITLLRGGETR